jgi:hypothetical protein
VTPSRAIDSPLTQVRARWGPAVEEQFYADRTYLRQLLQAHPQWTVQAEHYAGLPAAVSHRPRVHLAFQEGSSLIAPEVEQRPLSVYAQLVEVSYD